MESSEDEPTPESGDEKSRKRQKVTASCSCSQRCFNTFAITKEVDSKTRRRHEEEETALLSKNKQISTARKTNLSSYQFEILVFLRREQWKIFPSLDFVSNNEVLSHDILRQMGIGGSRAIPLAEAATSSSADLPIQVVLAQSPRDSIFPALQQLQHPLHDANIATEDLEPSRSRMDESDTLVNAEYGAQYVDPMEGYDGGNYGEEASEEGNQQPILPSAASVASLPTAEDDGIVDEDYDAVSEESNEDRDAAMYFPDESEEFVKEVALDSVVAETVAALMQERQNEEENPSAGSNSESNSSAAASSQSLPSASSSCCCTIPHPSNTPCTSSSKRGKIRSLFEERSLFAQPVSYFCPIHCVG